MSLRFLLSLVILLTFFACKIEEKKTNTQSVETKVGLDNGRWINEKDINAGIEIKDGKFILFQKVADSTVNAMYDYELSEKDGVEYVTLKNNTAKEIIYGLLEYSEDSMVLSYLDRGSTLTYTKEK